MLPGTIQRSGKPTHWHSRGAAQKLERTRCPRRRLPARCFIASQFLAPVPLSAGLRDALRARGLAREMTQWFQRTVNANNTAFRIVSEPTSQTGLIRLATNTQIAILLGQRKRALPRQASRSPQRIGAKTATV